MAAASCASEGRPLQGLFLILLACLIALAKSSSVEELDNARLALDIWKAARRSLCVNSAGKCFSSGQCCEGLICAAIDDYFGQKPEVPGYCVREKDLQGCTSSGDCQKGTKCVSLGRTGEKYCLPRSELNAQEPSVKDDTKHGGLGAHCTASADCRTSSEVPLCCQDVRRGRQGVRRSCDRVTPISICL